MFIHLYRYRKRLRRSGHRVVNQGPWCNWKNVQQTHEWDSWLHLCRKVDSGSMELLTEPAATIAGNREMYLKQVVNLFQMMYHLSKKIKEAT